MVSSKVQADIEIINKFPNSNQEPVVSKLNLKYIKDSSTVKLNVESLNFGIGA